jgi:hypothetical protein
MSRSAAPEEGADWPVKGAAALEAGWLVGSGRGRAGDGSGVDRTGSTGREGGAAGALSRALGATGAGAGLGATDGLGTGFQVAD